MAADASFRNTMSSIWLASRFSKKSALGDWAHCAGLEIIPSITIKGWLVTPPALPGKAAGEVVELRRLSVVVEPGLPELKLTDTPGTRLTKLDGRLATGRSSISAPFIDATAPCTFTLFFVP